MEGISDLIEKFLNKHKKSKFCFSPSEIKKDQGWSFNNITKDFIEKNINWNDVIMVLQEGIVFKKKHFVVLIDPELFDGFDTSKEYKFKKFEYEEIKYLNGKPKTGGNFLWVKESDRGYISYKNKKIKYIATKDYELFHLINELKDGVQSLHLQNLEKEKKKRTKDVEEENKRLRLLNKKRNDVLLTLDKDNNGVPDIIEEETFNLMLEHYELELSEKEKEYSTEFTLKFVRLSKFLSFKKDLIITSFKSLNSINDLKKLEYSVKLLDSQIQHSLLPLSNL